jgi:hypothetical protein
MERMLAEVVAPAHAGRLTARAAPPPARVRPAGASTTARPTPRC